ncbi:hypothetical protein FS837_009960 [Tulasnella sp. UAMH 9824]|nr:hypothetical protein FS837_009960 [Tulasnella sp. UAMH 9824]
MASNVISESSTALFEDQPESEVFQFRGKDSQECEEFISAITKHAYNQGKLRDDEWIADLVATCLTHDALRWWSGLDKGTRESWDKLRQAMFSRYQPKFYGKSGEEAEEFVHTVRQRARDAGRQKDNDWIITYVSDCFVGDALRWHVSLDQSIQDDWKMLQVAILVQWRREGGMDLPAKSGESSKSHSLIADSGITCHYRMPTPAPAAPAPPKLKRSRIRIGNNGTSYWSKTPDSNGLPLTSSAADALVVEYDPSVKVPQMLLIPDVRVFRIISSGPLIPTQYVAEPDRKL